MNGPRIDYHMHTTRCNHAVGSMDDYVKQAISVGLAEIGFSEHLPVMPEAHLCMSYEQMPGYVDEVHRLQDTYGDRITIRLGGEMDMNLDRASEIEDIIARYPFDYIIGSVHYLGDWPFDQEQYRDQFDHERIEDIYRRFIDTVAEGARTGYYDISGHIDNLKRMGTPPPESMTPALEHLADVFAETNVAVEVNTGGYDHPAAEAYPSPLILTMLNARGVPVTLGSDAHAPEQVGRHFDRAAELLVSTGYDRIAVFDGRQRTLLQLHDMEAQ